MGFPIARACTVVSLATACVCDLAIGPYEGKQTGENALPRNMLPVFDNGDVVVFDRYYCSFMMLAMLSLGGVHVCTRLHQRRASDFRRGRRLGQDDYVVTWTRPAKPAWMSREQYDRIPHTLTLRELRFNVTVPGRRTETLTVVTTLTDARAYAKEDIAELYGLRWNAELDIRAIKQTLGLDHVRCSGSGDGSPGVVGDVVGLQSDPQADRHLRGHPRQTAASAGLHPGLPDGLGVPDVAEYPIVFRPARHARHPVGADRRQRGG